MYVTDFVCTYKLLDDETLYRIQFLQALNINKWDGVIIDKVLTSLQEKCATYSEFKTVIDKLGGGDLGFLLLFSYEYFNYTHLCICDMLTKEKIEKIHYDELIKVIDKNL